MCIALYVFSAGILRDGRRRDRGRKIYADMSGPMDTIIWEFEAESLDQFFQLERGFFVHPDTATQQVIAAMNGGAVEGRREIYEVIV